MQRTDRALFFKAIISFMKQCLNCGNILKGPYCEACGQKGSTHRMSLKHFVQHDLIHGIWHVDKGLLFTIWQLIIRPARFLRQYLAGRRVGVFNVVTLLIIGAGLVLYISDFEGQMNENAAVVERKDIPELARNFYYFIEHHAKWLILATIPLFSLVSFLVFRRKKYFYTEHLIINSYLFGTFLFLLLVLGLIFKLPFLAQADEENFDLLLALCYLPYAYWSFWKPEYSVAGLVWRSLLAAVLFMLFGMMVLIGIVRIVLLLNGK